MNNDDNKVFLDDTGTPYVSYVLDNNGELLEGVRTDGDVDITLNLTEEEQSYLIKAAKTSGMSVDEFIMQVLEDEMKKAEPFGDYPIIS